MTEKYSLDDILSVTHFHSRSYSIRIVNENTRTIAVMLQEGREDEVVKAFKKVKLSEASIDVLGLIAIICPTITQTDDVVQMNEESLKWLKISYGDPVAYKKALNIIDNFRKEAKDKGYL